MNPKNPIGIRKTVTGLALAVGTLAAIPASLADTYGAPYYDPVRDVMVTPRISTSSRAGYAVSPVMSSPGAVGVTHEPIYGSAVPTSPQFYGSTPSASTSSRAIRAPVPGVQAVPQSSAGLEQLPTAGISPSMATESRTVAQPSRRTYVAAAPQQTQPYYDPERDVMVTPSQSGTVSYMGAPPSQRVTMAQGLESSFELMVRNGRLVQGPTSMTVDHGSEVTLIVDSNMADSLRIDGYNLVAPIAAGQPMLLKFVAEQPGRFAYRLSSGREIGVLEVGPSQPAPGVGMR